MENQPEQNIEWLRRALAECGHYFGLGTLHRFIARHGLTRKKDGAGHRAGAAGRRTKRGQWREGQPRLDPERLVFIEKTWVSIAMARTQGGTPRRQRLRRGRAHLSLENQDLSGWADPRRLVAP